MRDIDKTKELLPLEVQSLIIQAKKELEEIFDTVHDAITIHDKDFNIIRANKAAEKLLELPFHEYHGADSPPENCQSCHILKTGVPMTTVFFEPKLNKYLEVRAIPRFDKDNQIAGVVHVVRDITKQKQMEEELVALSLTDELTGLYNRRGYVTLATQSLKMLKRENKSVFMLYADLDNLKWINDKLGHKEGDFALITAANILKENYRDSDIISRIGGDEFVVFPVGSSSDTIEAISSRLRVALDKYNKQSNRSYKLSMSMGISCYDPEHPCTIDELLDKADKLMYEEKSNKKLLYK
jgi:diguanylate cyclase (GGDEF)-like protein